MVWEFGKAIRLGWDLVGGRVLFDVGNGRKGRFWLDR